MGIKIFKVGEVDWIAARTEEQAIQCLADICYDGKVDCEDMKYVLEDGVEELSAESLDKHKHGGEDGCQDGYPITFRQELDKLIAKNITFPVHFASSEI